MRNSEIIKSFENIQKYEDNVYDITIIKNDIDIGTITFYYRCLRLEVLKKRIIKCLEIYPDSKYIKNLYQNVDFKSELLLLVEQR